LDASTEEKIKKAIEKASAFKTTLIIAHRISTIKNSDKIIVLDKGQIIAIGNHDELTENCPQYKYMVNLQNISS